MLETTYSIQQNDSTSIITFEPKRLITASPAWTGHLPFANYLVKKIKPGILVELGSHTGNSLCGFAQAVKEEGLSTQIYGVDTWQGDAHAGTYNDNIYQKLHGYVSIEYSYLTLLRMTFDQALATFSDESIDILHIDGLHTYNAVKHDFTTWLPKVKKTGIILFHDTQVQNKDFGVFRFWEELKQQYHNVYNFPHSHGLGVLFMPDALTQPAQKELYDALSNSLITKALIEKGEYIRLNALVQEEQKLRRYEYIAKSNTLITIIRSLVWKTWSLLKGAK